MPFECLRFDESLVWTGFILSFIHCHPNCFVRGPRLRMIANKILSFRISRRDSTSVIISQFCLQKLLKSFLSDNNMSLNYFQQEVLDRINFMKLKLNNPAYFGRNQIKLIHQVLKSTSFCNLYYLYQVWFNIDIFNLHWRLYNNKLPQLCGT